MVSCFDDNGINDIKTVKDIDDMKLIGSGGANLKSVINAFNIK